MVDPTVLRHRFSLVVEDLFSEFEQVVSDEEFESLSDSDLELLCEDELDGSLSFEYGDMVRMMVYLALSAGIKLEEDQVGTPGSS